MHVHIKQRLLKYIIIFNLSIKPPNMCVCAFNFVKLIYFLCIIA